MQSRGTGVKEASPKLRSRHRKEIAILSACTRAVLCAGLFAAPIAAQDLHTEIDLFGLGDPLAPAKPFGITHEPVSDRLFVALSGDFAGANRAVVIIDPATDTVVGTIDVGLFPEDIAFAYDSSGNLLYGAVTNSTDGSITIWDAADQVVTTVVLPDAFGLGTCYPFGIVAKDGYFYISTQDGSGDVHAVDWSTQSYDAAASFNIDFRSGSRMAVNGDALWIPSTEFLPAFEGGMGGLYTHDLSGSFADDTWFAAYADQFLGYPSGQDVALMSDGSAYLTGLDFGGRLFKVDANGQLDRAIDCEGIDGYGLAVSADESLLAVAGLVANEVLLIDLHHETLLSRTDVVGLGSGSMQPNDAVFTHGKLYVTVQSNERVLVFDNLPTVSGSSDFHGSLTLSDSTPDRGDQIILDLIGTPGFPVALMSSTGTAPTTHLGVDLLIGTSLLRRASDVDGDVQVILDIPLNPALQGRQFFLQGYVPDGAGDHVTAPKVLVIQ